MDREVSSGCQYALLKRWKESPLNSGRAPYIILRRGGTLAKELNLKFVFRRQLS